MILPHILQSGQIQHIPFFHFSGKDFFQQGQTTFWPIGVLDVNGHPMGTRTFGLSCPSGKVHVTDQKQLLANLYAGRTLPSPTSKAEQEYLTLLGILP